MRLQTLVLDLASNLVLNVASIVTPTLARNSALNQEAQGAGAPRWGESGEALPPPGEERQGLPTKPPRRRKSLPGFRFFTQKQNRNSQMWLLLQELLLLLLLLLVSLFAPPLFKVPEFRREKFRSD